MDLDQAAPLLRSMLLIRAFEAALMRRPDHGFQLLSQGEEGVAVGVCAGLTEHDQLLCSGRSIAPALARGLAPGSVMAELLGRSGGPCRGQGGRGHIADPAAGFFGAHAVVAGNLTIAAGVALALQSEGRGGVAVCLFGDGACGAGALHETLNIAALWKLPLVLVCDNNGLAISTPRTAALAPAALADLAAPFGVPGAAVDGSDVLAVAAQARLFVEAARAGAGPAFLECRSPRLATHSSSTRETRSKTEMEALRQRCPIAVLAARLEAVGLMTQEDRMRMEGEAAAAVAEAEAFAEASPPADIEEALRHVG